MFSNKSITEKEDKKHAELVGNIDTLVDDVLTRNKGSFSDAKVEKKRSSDEFLKRGVNKNQIKIVKNKLPTRKILAVVLTFILIFVVIPASLPYLYGGFDSDVAISLHPENVHDGDSMFINVTIPSYYHVRSVAADVSGIETLDLSLIDNSTDQQLWQVVWLAHDVEVGEHIVKITALDPENKSYGAEVRWSVLADEVVLDGNYSGNKTSEFNNSVLPINETSDELNNQTIDENYSGMPVNETIDKINNGTASDNITTSDEAKLPSEDFYGSSTPYEITGRVNWSKFWKFFNYYDDWGLQYNQSGNWIWVNGSLDVGIVNVADNLRKLILNFTAPYAGEYKVVLKVRRGALTYSFDPDSNTFDVVYPNFNFLFDYSDIAHLPNLDFDHGLDGGYFWFSVSRDNIPQGLHVSLDPQYTIVTGALSDSTEYNGQRRVATANLDDIYVVVQMDIKGITNIVFFRSTDGGSSWTRVNITKDDTYNQYHPSMAIDSVGKLHVVWEGYDADNPDYLQIRYSVSSDAGANWDAPVDLTREEYDQTYPSIAVDSSDRLHVVWCGKSSGSTTRSQIRYIRYDGSWGSVADITSETYDQYNPSIALGSTDLINVVWEATTSFGPAYQIRYDFSPDNGDSWNGAQNLISTLNYDQNYPCIAIDSSDKCWVVWSGKHAGSATNYQIRYAAGGGGSWTSVGNITSQNVNHYAPSIAIDSKDVFHVVFYGPPFDLDVANDIRYSKSATAGSSWTAAINLTSGAAGDQQWANALWAKYPETQTPEQGYAFIYCNTTKVMYNSSTDLDLDYPPEAAYSSGAANTYGGKMSTTFVTTHTDPNGIDDVDDCRIKLLDSGGTPTNRIELMYNVDNSTLWISYGSSYVSISGCSVTKSAITNGYSLTWQFIPDWDWPFDDSDFDVVAWTDDESGDNSSDQGAEAGTTTHENDLIIYSITQYTLNSSAYSQDGNTVLTENEWFRGGVQVKCSGVVTYEGTTNVYPPTTAVDVQLWANGANLGASFQDETLGSNGEFETPYNTTTSASGMDSDFDFNVSLVDFTTGASQGSGQTTTLRNSRRDNEPPISSVTAISPYWKSTSPITIAGTASDASGCGLKNVTLWYSYRATNASGWGGWVSSGLVDTNPWVSISWSFTPSNGTGHYEFYSKAVDNVSNIEIFLGEPPPADAQCGYDNAAPSSSVDAITPYWKKAAATITATASDATSGVKNVTLYYRFSSNNASWGGNVSGGVDTASPWSWSFSFSNGSGHYQFYSIAADNATNSESAPGSADAKCGYDTTAPTSSVDAITPYLQQNNPLAINATASDNGSGLKNVTLWYQWSNDNSSWGSTSSSTYYFTEYDIGGQEWNLDPSFMVDGDEESYASTKTDRVVEYIYTPDGTGTGTITYVHLRCKAYNRDNNGGGITLQPLFQGGIGDEHAITLTDYPAWYTVDITNDTNTHPPWIWSDFDSLKCYVTANLPAEDFVYCSIVQIIVGTNDPVWIRWNNTGNPDTTPWSGVSWNFNFPNGTGYYEFYSIATDNVSNTESAPGSADAICQLSAPSIVYVDDDFNAGTSGWGYDHFDVIQDGIDAVALNGTVYVWNGTYNERVYINNSLSLIGNSSTNTTIDTPQANENVVQVNSNFTNISGFKIINGAHGINLVDRHDCRFENNNCSDNTHGIVLSSSYNNYVLNNTIYSNSQYGIYIETSVIINTISNNSVFSNPDSIYLKGVENCMVDNNTISNGNSGIAVESCVASNTLCFNNILSCNVGIWFVGGSESFNINIYSNEITSSTQDGILISGDSNIIHGNFINDSANYGIYINSGDSNSIYNNYFNNTNNAYDGDTNDWEIEKTAGTNIIGKSYLGGNYWSDYTGMDTDGDWLGDTDTPYNAGGDITNGGDSLPLLYNSAPTQNGESPTNGQTGVSIDLNNISVTINDQDGDSMNWTIETSPDIGSAHYNESYQLHPSEHSMSGAGVDGDWSTGEQAQEQGNYGFFNYTTPTGAVNAVWEVKDAFGRINYTLPVAVLNESIVRIRGYFNMEDSFHYEVYYSGNWNEFAYEVGSFPNYNLYETAMHWKYNSSNGTKSCYVSGLTTDTTYTWYVNITDGYEYTREWYQFTTQEQPDNIKPSSNVTDITPYWHNSGGNPLTITCTDATDTGSSGLKNVTLYYYNSTDNSTWSGPWNFGVDSDPWVACSWNFNFPNGTRWYRFYSCAADNNSNAEDAPVTNDTECGYDTQKPSSSVDTISPYTVTSSPLTVTATANDLYNGNTISGVKNVTLWYRYSNDNSTWWNSSWTYRKQCNVSNNLDDYQMQIIVGNSSGGNVTCGGHAQSDFDDIRFVNSTGTELPYWMVNYTTDDQATFWINNSYNDSLIWMYYGNAGASTTSNGNTTFDLFDDFNRADSATVGNSWTEDEDSGVGALSIESNTLKIVQYENYFCHIEKAAPALSTFVVQWKTKSEANGGTTWMPTAAIYWGAYEWTHMGIRANNLWVVEWDKAGTYTYNADMGSGTVTNWYYYRIRIDSTNAYYDVSSDGQTWTNLKSTAKGTNWGTPTLIIVGKGYAGNAGSYPNSDLDNSFATAGNSGTTYADTVFVRKFATTEPSWSSFGSEDAWIQWSDASNPDTSSPWSWSFDFPNGTGYYEFYSMAYDNATNNELAPGNADAKCGYDTTAPSSSVDAISPYINTTGSVELTATASDALSGVKNVTLWYRYSVDNFTWSESGENAGIIANSAVDSWELDGEEGKVCNPTALLKLGTSEYYVTSACGDTGSDNDGFLRTMKVWNDNGTFVKILADTWEYDTSDSYYAGITHISGDIYAVIYYDSSIGKVITTRIWESNGTMQKTIIDTFNLAYRVQLYPSLIHVTGNIYAAVYKESGGGHDHQLETIEIDTNGIITNSRLDLVEFDATSTSSGDTIGLTSAVMVDSDTIAIVWQETVGSDGWLVTYNISAAGDITNAYADIWEFDGTKASYPFIYHIAGNVFAITYADTDDDGWTNTVTIDDNGKITKAWIDTLEWGNADTVVYPSMFTVADAVNYSPGVYSITYRDKDWKGRISTFNISSNGTIGGAIIDVLQFSPGYNYDYAPCVSVSGNYYLIVYEGTGNDGWSLTVDIETPLFEDTCMQWSDASNPDTSSPWNWNFAFPNGTGYYEFYSIAADNANNVELAPDSADAICRYYIDTTFTVTPDLWAMGDAWIEGSNTTTGYYFNLTNNGNVAISLTIKASNATNSTTGFAWNLTSSPGYNNFTLSYNKSGVGAWKNINLTYDAFIENLAQGDYQTFDFKILMATISSEQNLTMHLQVTFKSVIA